MARLRHKIVRVSTDQFQVKRHTGIPARHDGSEMEKSEGTQTGYDSTPMPLPALQAIGSTAFPQPHTLSSPCRHGTHWHTRCFYSLSHANTEGGSFLASVIK